MFLKIILKITDPKFCNVHTYIYCQPKQKSDWIITFLSCLCLAAVLLTLIDGVCSFSFLKQPC